ncbi:MAG: zinc metallopeptidase [Anaerolineae bacterium]|nr:zinc metallopeptidase [Anaerolineae bacterium]
MYFDPNYLLCVMLPALLLSGLAQMMVRNAYSTWSKRANSSGLTGVDTARQLMQKYGLNVALEGTPQELGDHFDPRGQVVRFSPGVARQPSVASMAIAAHEFGHVQQYAQNSPLIAVRGFLIPAVQIGSNFSYILIIAGLLMNVLALSFLGLVLFGAAVLFSILTLPVELDASRRAMNMLDGAGLLRSQEDRSGAQAVLRAAAMTYLAAMVTSILQFAYYAMLVLGGRSRD